MTLGSWLEASLHSIGCGRGRLSALPINSTSVGGMVVGRLFLYDGMVFPNFKSNGVICPVADSYRLGKALFPASQDDDQRRDR